MDELGRPRRALLSQYQREKRLTDGRINLRGWRREQGRKVNLRRPRWLSAFAGKVEAGVVSLYSHNEKGEGEEEDLVLII